MSEEMLPGIEELDFERESVHKLYQSGANGINPERWERARNDIRFEDVVAELTGHRDNVIRCPFHGRDRRPSFTLYPRHNDAYCFGCPPGQMYYDSVTFVSKYMECNRVQALQWLEKTFDLPYMPDVQLDDEEESGGLLTFWDLAEPFILKVSREVQETKDPELAEDYIRIYFTGLSLEKAAKEAEKEAERSDEDDPQEMHLEATLKLAEFLGKEQLTAITNRKEF
jgi:DNA primase